MRVFCGVLLSVSLLQGMELPDLKKTDFLTAKALSCSELLHTPLAFLPNGWGFWAGKDGSVHIARVSENGEPLGNQRTLRSDEGYCLESLVSPAEGFGYLWKKKGEAYYLVSIYPGAYDAGFCSKILKAKKPYPLACFDKDILLIRRESDIVEADTDGRILLKKQTVVYAKPEGKKFPDYEALQESSRAPIAVANGGTIVCMDECGEIELFTRDKKTHQLTATARIVAFLNMPDGKFAVHGGYAFAYDVQGIYQAKLGAKKPVFTEACSLTKKCDAISGAFHPKILLAAVACAFKKKQKTKIILFSPKEYPRVYTIGRFITNLQWPTEKNMLWGMSEEKSVCIMPEYH